MSRVLKSIFFVAMPVIVLCLSSFQNCEAAAKNKVVTGVISNFDCEGSPCLLTVVDGKGKEHDGICSDKICDKWNEEEKMPAEFKGKKVKVTVVESQGGHGRGSSDEFIKLELLK